MPYRHTTPSTTLLTGAEADMIHQVVAEAAQQSGLPTTPSDVDDDEPVTLAFLHSRWTRIASPDPAMLVGGLSGGGELLLNVPIRVEERVLLRDLIYAYAMRFGLAADTDTEDGLADADIAQRAYDLAGRLWNES